MNNEPVAYVSTAGLNDIEWTDASHSLDYGDALYSHPVKELTLSPDEIFDIWDEHTDYDGNFVTSVDDFVLAILRKAQEK